MTGLQGLIVKADALDVTGGSKKESFPDAALFAALLGGEVQQAEVKELRKSTAPETVEPVFIKPATPEKRETATPSVLNGTALFSVVGLMEETPDALIKNTPDFGIGLEFEPQPSAEFGTGQSPEETVLSNDVEQRAIQITQPTPPFRHPSAGGDFKRSPPAEGWPTASAEAFGKGWKAGVGIPAVHTTALQPLNVKPEASTETIVLPEEVDPVQLAGTPAQKVAPAPTDGLIPAKEQTGKPAASSVTNGTKLSSVQPNPPRPSATSPTEGNFSQDVSICTVPLLGGVREARGGLIHPEILAAMEPVRKRTPRTAIDPIIGREPAAPETIRTVPPAHAGAVAIPLSDSRAADLQKLIDTFDRHMLSMVQQGDKMTRVTLNSREMGRLTVVCHEETSGLKIEIQAQNSAVQAALQRHETAVRQLLQAHGSAVGKFDVTCGDGRNTDPRRFGRGRGFFEEFPDGGIEPACSAGSEIEPLMARAPAHAVSIFA